MLDRLFAWRGVLLGALGVGVVLAAQPAVSTFASGAALVALGLVLRLWSFAHLGPAGRTRDPAAPRSRVVTGPYRWVAHPVYVANCVVALGLTLAAAPAPPVAALALACVAAAYGAMALRESRLLAGVPARRGVVLRGVSLARSERSTWLSVGVLLLAIAARL